MVSADGPVQGWLSLQREPTATARRPQMRLTRPPYWALTVVAIRRVLAREINPGGISMLSIAYVSAAAVEMTDEDIAAILVQARANNIRHDLTGALLYHQSRFIQILEGPNEQVLSRFAVISADSRHRSIYVVSEEPIRERQFPQWTMGFRPLADDAVKALSGYDDFFDGSTGEVRPVHANNQAQQFLEWLGEYWFAHA
jgi:hypothetical protein